MEDYIISDANEQLSPVVVVATALLILGFAVGIVYQLVLAVL
ncbi:hypothetical protein ACNS7O_02445 [Haloferacaceae archaeon DSL9]